jgi:hypothetical protein
MYAQPSEERTDGIKGIQSFCSMQTHSLHAQVQTPAGSLSELIIPTILFSFLGILKAM